MTSNKARNSYNETFIKSNLRCPIVRDEPSLILDRRQLEIAIIIRASWIIYPQRKCSENFSNALLPKNDVLKISLLKSTPKDIVWDKFFLFSVFFFCCYRVRGLWGILVFIIWIEFMLDNALGTEKVLILTGGIFFFHLVYLF